MSTKKIECGAEPQWLEERKKRIGASEVPSVMGLNPYEGPDTLWARKAGAMPTKEKTEAMELGIAMEPAIRQAFAAQSGMQVGYDDRFTLLVNDAYPYMHATLDGTVWDGSKTGVLEIKNVGEKKAAEWDGDVPTMYAAQVQAQLAVTGYEFGYLVALIGGQRLRWHRVARHPEFIRVMTDKVGVFWHSLQEKKPPEFKSDEAWAAWLKASRPVEGKVIELAGPALEVHARLETLKREIKARETELLHVSNQLRSIIGDAEEANLPDGSRYTLKVQKRKEHVVRASESRVLRYVGGSDD